MAITKRDPNVVALHGPGTEDNTTAAIEAITPGMLLEPHDDSGTRKWGVHDSADAFASPVFALDQPELNLGVDDAYAAGDLVRAGYFRRGDIVWAIIPSGQDIANSDILQSNGDGKLKAIASGTAIAVALEDKPTVTVDTRIRVEIV